MIKKNDLKTVIEIMRANKVGSLELLHLTNILRKAVKDTEMSVDTLYTDLKKKLNK